LAPHTSAWACWAELMEEEVDEIVGPKGKHDAHRTAMRHRHEAGEVTLGGRRVGPSVRMCAAGTGGPTRSSQAAIR
jgi:putative transposase